MLQRVDAATLTRAKTYSLAEPISFAVMVVALIIAPFFLYPLFLMQVLCFALFACAFNLLIGYVGLLSFGHALYFGWASYVSAHAAKVWGFQPEFAIFGWALEPSVADPSDYDPPVGGSGGEPSKELAPVG